MRLASIAAALMLLGATSATAQVDPRQPPAAPPPATAPLGSQQPPAPGTVVPPPVVPPLLTASRTFLGQTGMIFQSVRPDRVIDFETVIGLLTDALKTSTDAAVQEQAKGWRVFKATEPGPNATILYVFVIDPAVAGADYGIGRILADAYPDKIQEIWKLYTGSLAPSASLLNLTLIEGPPAPLPVTEPDPTTTTPAPVRPGPPPVGTTPRPVTPQ